MVQHRRTLAALGATAGMLLAAGPARAATLTVDDDHAQCPAAGYSSVQSAIDAAAPGDTVIVCEGAYAEGSGALGSNAVTITKSLTLKGVGADLVSITPRATTPIGGQILEAAPDIRNGVGDIVAVVGAPTKPITVDLSGITVDGFDANRRPIAVEAGILFLDAKGSVYRSRVTDVVTSEADGAYARPGGWRGTQPGYGIVQTSSTVLAPVDGVRDLVIESTRVDKYNKVGVLIDGATNDTWPFAASGALNRGYFTADQIVGRTECVNYAGTGNCASVGLLTTGPLFGQDGIRVTNGGRAVVTDSLITQNLVNGTGAPTRDSPDNNANLSLGAGLRFVGAALNTFSSGTPIKNSSVTSSNIVDNAYGVLSYQADGTTATSGNPAAVNAGNVLKAENNWWGVRFSSPTNPGPAISPTKNPQVPENGVNGIATPDGAGTTSNAVDFYPFRSGPQADPTSGQFAIIDAPLQIDDAPPAVALTATATAEPGDTVSLTAAATDDFGVKSVTFYDGARRIATASVPPYAATLAVPAACPAARTLTAMVEDSSGQTSTGSATVQVNCPAPPTPNPAPVPAKPAIAFVAAPSTLAGRTTVSFTPTTPGGLGRIDVFLGTRLACTVKAAPFACTIAPSGADVGVQALRAVVTDALGATAEASVSVRVPKFTPSVSLTVARRAASGGKVRRTISGRLVLPSAVTKAQGCHAARVTVAIKRSGRSISNQQLKVSSTCTFKTSITAAGKASFSVSARFGGNAALAAAAKTRRFS
jgi:hypothetical protein